MLCSSSHNFVPASSRPHFSHDSVIGRPLFAITSNLPARLLAAPPRASSTRPMPRIKRSDPPPRWAGPRRTKRPTSSGGSCFGASWGASPSMNSGPNGASVGESARASDRSASSSVLCRSSWTTGSSEWTASRSDARRFPFYHEVKTLVVLWLVLPQIQVSSLC